MKDKIIVFAIGFLVGAIVASGGFYVYSILSNDESEKTHEMGEAPQMGDRQTPPQMPNGQPPQKPDENTTTTDENVPTTENSTREKPSKKSSSN